MSDPAQGAAVLAANARGMGLMLGSTVVFSAVHAMVRHVTAELHPFEVVFFRNLFGLVVLLPVVLRPRTGLTRSKRPGMHLVRVSLQVVSLLLFFYGLHVTPLAKAIALGFTGPIFATVLAVLVLGERVGVHRWSAVLAGFAGTLLVVRPDSLHLEQGAALVLASSVLFAGGLTLLKLLARSDPPLTLTAYSLLLLAPLSLPAALFVWEWPTWTQLGWLLAIGALSGIGLLMFTAAVHAADMTVVMPLDYVRLLWTAAIGFIAFAEVPEPAVIAGGLVIALSASYIGWRESRLRAPRVAP